MCSTDAPDPVVPATPPPPPPVLEQAAPEQAAPTQSDELKKQATGNRKYRTGLSIGANENQNTTSNGLGISQ